MFETLIEIIKQAAVATAGQILTVMGFMFAAGIALFVLARFTRNTVASGGSYKLDIFLTGWIGTPVHEIGHALFALLFGHKIVEMKLYTPGAENGSLGYVNHTYNPKNWYHKIGNFFIGAGPVFFGTFILYLFMDWFVPNKDEIFSMIFENRITIRSLTDFITAGELVLGNAKQLISMLFHQNNFYNKKFWLFLYLAVCVSSHMELSPPDIEGMFAGLGSLVIVLFAFNVGAIVLSIDTADFFITAAGYTSMISGFFILAVILSAVNFVMTYFLISIYSLLRRRGLPSPF